MLQKHINSKEQTCTLCLGNISKDFTINNMKKLVFSVDFNLIDTNDILDIHKHLIKRT